MYKIYVYTCTITVPVLIYVAPPLPLIDRLSYTLTHSRIYIRTYIIYIQVLCAFIHGLDYPFTIQPSRQCLLILRIFCIIICSGIKAHALERHTSIWYVVFQLVIVCYLQVALLSETPLLSVLPLLLQMEIAPLCVFLVQLMFQFFHAIFGHIAQ